MVAHTIERTARILLVDDHPLIRTGFAELISREPDLQVCGESGNAEEALQLVQEHLPDLALIDLKLRSGDGLDLCARLSTTRPDLRILVVSIRDERLYAERTLRAGAHGFISKEADQAQLLEAIRAVLSGGRWLSPAMSNRLLARVQHSTSAVSPIETLSERELSVLRLIGKGFGTKQIADEFQLSPKTIESYRENLKRKLSLEHTLELTRYAVHWVLEQQ